MVTTTIGVQGAGMRIKAVASVEDLQESAEEEEAVECRRCMEAVLVAAPIDSIVVVDPEVSEFD